MPPHAATAREPRWGREGSPAACFSPRRCSPCPPWPAPSAGPPARCGSSAPSPRAAPTTCSAASRPACSTEAFGVPFVVENRPGAGGNLGMEAWRAPRPTGRPGGRRRRGGGEPDALPAPALRPAARLRARHAARRGRQRAGRLSRPAGAGCRRLRSPGAHEPQRHHLWLGGHRHDPAPGHGAVPARRSVPRACTCPSAAPRRR